MKNKKTFQPIIKWSGSKRKIAYDINNMFPENFNSYYEPFIGGGSILYTVTEHKKIASDINKPLIDLWTLIRDNPNELYEHYLNNWQLLNDDNNEEAYKTFYNVRERFNELYNPADLFFLSRTCVNGLIRFNKQGEFNNSLHYTRKGIHPDRLKNILNDWSSRISNTEFHNCDYSKSLEYLKKGDFVYLDPPYFNTKGMYYGAININDFLNYLEKLNSLGIRYLLSFDGKTCSKDYTFDIPEELFKKHIYIHTGSSTFNKVIDKKQNKVEESVYMNY
ncbi:MAG: DNA adenine methylase [Halarcobacter sp.]